MAIRRNEKTVTCGELQVTVHELTVSDVREWLQKITNESEQQDLVGDTLFSEMSFRDIERMTDLTVEQINEALPSDLRKVVDACKEVNPHFFELRGRLIAVGEKALEMGLSASTASALN